MVVRFEWVSTRRIGQITGVRDPEGWPLLTDTSVWGVVGVDLGANVVHDNRLYILFGDVAVADYDRQRANSDLIAWSTETEVLERGGHRASPGSWEFFLPNLEHDAPTTMGQPDWRFCGKCHSLFWAPNGSGQHSRCAYDGGEHAPNGLNFVLPNDHQNTGHLGQLGWRYCGRCRGLCWSPEGERPVGSCPAGGRHGPVGWIFAPPNDHQGGGAENRQGAWRFCGGCHGMFFDGYAGKGVCPGPLDDHDRPVPNGGGIRLEAVRGDGYFYPLTATDPVHMTTDLETPGGAFSHDGRLYAFVNISHPRWSRQERPGDPPFGTYLISSGAPDRAEPFLTEYQFSPRIGTCDRADVGGLAGHDPRGLMFVLEISPDHGEWRFCGQCHSMVHEPSGPGRCFGAGGGPHTPIGSRFVLPAGTAPHEQHQPGWRRCAGCQTAYYDGYDPAKGTCPATGAGHTPTEPLLRLPHKSFRETGPDGPMQARWRFCVKCAGIFWEDMFRNQRGVCPAGGGHDPWGLEFLLAFDRVANEHRQVDWRFCGRCNGLFWAGASGACPGDPARGPHQPGAGPQAQGFNFALTHDVPGDDTHQDNWRFCGKCTGLFWAGAGGTCPHDGAPHRAGSGPDAPGFNFVLPHNPGEDPVHQEHWRFCQRCFGLVYGGQLDRFAGATPWVVTTAEHPQLELPPSPSGRGAMILGFGYDHPAGFRLAWLPLPEHGTPRLTDTRYWTGSPNPATRWSPRIEDAANLFNRTLQQADKIEPLYASSSLAWLREPGVWVMLHSKATDERGLAERQLPIMARIATTPWDLATAPDIPVFDPVTLGAYGRYMNSTPESDELNVPPGGDEHMGWAYGAFLIERYCRWRAATRELDLVYLLSLSAPYQVQLMRTTLRMLG